MARGSWVQPTDDCHHHEARALKAAKPRKISVIAIAFYLGDVLLTTPLIRSLRQAYPDAELDMVGLCQYDRYVGR